MTAKLITLQQWAKNTYGEAAPCMNTLRKWARSNKITPPAEKHGRTYFVDPEASYSQPGKPKADAGPPVAVRAPREPQESATSLIKRMLRESSSRNRVKRSIG